MAESKLSKLKKAELQALGDHIGLPGGTDGLRNELETRLFEHFESQGGLQAVADKGKLGSKYIALFGLEATRSIPSPAETRKTKVTTNSGKKSTTEGSSSSANDDSWHSIVTEILVHSPARAIQFIGEHASKSGASKIMTDLRARISTPESLVLILLYVELFSIILGHLTVGTNPIVSVPIPGWADGIATALHLPIKNQKLNFYLPMLVELLNRKQFLYPTFYWFVYFVAIPSILGWLINFQAVSKKIGEHICPVNMLTFSFSRVLIFYLNLKKTVQLNDLFVGAAVQTHHKSLTVLFDGTSLPVKLFLTTCFVGLVYAFYEKK